MTCIRVDGEHHQHFTLREEISLSSRGAAGGHAQCYVLGDHEEGEVSSDVSALIQHLSALAKLHPDLKVRHEH